MCVVALIPLAWGLTHTVKKNYIRIFEQFKNFWEKQH